MHIKSLPQSTVVLMGSSQVLTTPESVVKELVENALDAEATSVTVEVSANTINFIQVHDNGRGIAIDDRDMLFKRHCTSKIGEFADIANITGKFLGFRGQALASAVELCASVTVTTRCDGEELACLMKTNKNMDISFEPASHPIGTTVRAEKLFSEYPVRAKGAAKPSATVKCVGRMKKLLHAYAFTRPTVRFIFKVSGANSDKASWMYTGSASPSMRDVAFSVAGHLCATQCQMLEIDNDSYRVEAVLPTMNASSTAIGDIGQFISIDARPVRADRGVLKQSVTLFRDRIRALDVSMINVKNPFMSMNITCPRQSYDVNIEPTKDDVIFLNDDKVLAAVRVLLDQAYPVQTNTKGNPKTCDTALRSPTFGHLLHQMLRSTSETPTSNNSPDSPVTWPGDICELDKDQDVSSSRKSQVHSDAFEGFQDDSDEMVSTDCGHVTILNPWTVAKMNTKVRPKEPTMQDDVLIPPNPYDFLDTNVKLVSPHHMTSLSSGEENSPTTLPPSSRCKLAETFKGSALSILENSGLYKQNSRSKEDDLLTVAGRCDSDILSSQVRPAVPPLMSTRDAYRARETNNVDFDTGFLQFSPHNIVGPVCGGVNQNLSRIMDTAYRRFGNNVSKTQRYPEGQEVWFDHLAPMMNKQKRRKATGKKTNDGASRNMDIRAFTLRKSESGHNSVNRARFARSVAMPLSKSSLANHIATDIAVTYSQALPSPPASLSSLSSTLSDTEFLPPEMVAPVQFMAQKSREHSFAKPQGLQTCAIKLQLSLTQLISHADVVEPSPEVLGGEVIQQWSRRITRLLLLISPRFHAISRSETDNIYRNLHSALEKAFLSPSDADVFS